MLLMFCMVTAKKIGPQFSFSFDCKGLHSKMEYRKKAIIPKYSVKIVQLPQHDSNEDIGSLFLDPTKYGQASEAYLKVFYQRFFDKTFDTKTTNAAYENFKSNMKFLFDLVDDKKYDKKGNYSASYSNSRKNACLDPEDSKDVYDALDSAPRVGRLVLGQDTTYVAGPEGLTLRSRVMDEAVFESANKIKIVVGPRQSFAPDQPFEKFKLANTVDDLNLSANFLTRTGIVAQMSGYQKDVEIIVVGAPGITEADVRKKVDAILQGDSYRPNVQSSAPKEVNVALMGSLGTSIAYHYHTPNFMTTLRCGLDYTWGKFCQTMALGADTEANPGLGFGAFVGAGIDYKCSEKTAFGLEGGLRLNQLTVPMLYKPTQKASTWFYTPYSQINATFFMKDNCALGLFTGYIFPKEFTVKSTGSRIPFGSSCKIGGLYSGLRLSKYF